MSIDPKYLEELLAITKVALEGAAAIDTDAEQLADRAIQIAHAASLRLERTRREAELEELITRFRRADAPVSADHVEVLKKAALDVVKSTIDSLNKSRIGPIEVEDQLNGKLLTMKGLAGRWDVGLEIQENGSVQATYYPRAAGEHVDLEKGATVLVPLKYNYSTKALDGSASARGAVATVLHIVIDCLRKSGAPIVDD